MVTILYRDRQWQKGRLGAYGPLSLSPASSVLHYGQAIFEGYKAYRQEDGAIRTFRPYANAERFKRSAARLAMPALPQDVFVAVGDALIEQDTQWYLHIAAGAWTCVQS